MLAERPAEPALADPDGSPGRWPRDVRRRVSAWHLATVLTAVTGLVLTADVVHDPDVYWHRIVGEHLLSGDWGLHPDPISYSAGRAWFSTSWLMDVVYAVVVDHAGYAGVVGLRFALAVAFYAGLGLLVTRAGAPPAAAFVVALVVGLPAFTVMQDRPQTVSLLFILVLSATFDRLCRGRPLPPWWVVAAFTWMWANIHGLWVLVPVSLVLLALRGQLERRYPRQPSANAIRLAAVAVVAAACTPIGPRLFLSIWRVPRAAGSLIEWQATVPTAIAAWGLTGALVLVALGWARTTRPVPWADVLCCVAWGGFGLLAFRNAVPASLMLAPVAARSLALSVPSLRQAALRVPLWTLPAVAALGVLLGIVRYAQVPVISPRQPAAIAATLRSLPDSRVMPAYDVSGFVREMAGDGVRVAIDGRADKWGDETIRRYGAAFERGDHWRSVVRQYDPDYVVADRRSALPGLLIRAGWLRLQRDGDFLLLRAPAR